MIVVQINADYNSGSIGRTTYEIHKYLLNKGHKSYVFSSEYSEEKNFVFKIGNYFDHKYHGLMSRVTGLEGYFSYFATKSLLKKLKKINPDIIHLRNLHAHYINFPLLLKYLSENDIATVVTFHDLWLMTGHCCYYNNVNCYKWQTECGKCPALKYDQVSWFFDTSKKCFNDKKRLLTSIRNLAVIGNSKWTTLQVKQSFLNHSKVIKHIYNWIDQQQFFYRDPKQLVDKYELQNNFVVLGVANGWSFRKGLEVFVKLAHKMPDLKIVLVGNRIDNSSLPTNILSVDTTNSVEELCMYYSMANVFINPSSQETFGKVTAEALCCGTPVIVNNATANPEIVGSGCGYIVDDNNIDDIIEVILIIQEKGRMFYSKKCVDFVSNSFNKNEIIQNYMDLYKSLIDNK